MKSKEKWLIALLLVVILASFVVAGKISIGLTQASAGLPGGRWNVLVVSVCSMRKDLFATYGRERTGVMPASDEFFRQASVVYDRAFNGVTWISFISFMERYFPLLTGQGVLSASPYWEYPMMRIPLSKYLQPGVTGTSAAEEVNDSDFEKDYKAYAEFVKQQILLPRQAPFMLIVHVKYLHYPLIDRFNPESQWDYFLTEGERLRIQQYLKHPEIYYAKLPLLLMLTNDPKFAVAHPAIGPQLAQRDAVSLRRLTGLVSNQKYLSEWKASDGFADDLKILEKIYEGNARYMDQQILKPMFDLYGNPDLQKSTVVVLAGDHGELHMEHDHLTHADAPYDEAIEIPAAIRFPRDWKPQVRVKKQINIFEIADTVEGIVSGALMRDNIEEQINSKGGGVVLIRDCRNTWRALRADNKWKFVVDAASGERQLFDLESDPGELINVASSKPEIADQMEALYWQNLERFKWIPPYRCLPW